jgi:hypothetical protein
VWNAPRRAPDSILTGYPISVELMNGRAGLLVAPPAVVAGSQFAPGLRGTVAPDALFQPIGEVNLSFAPAREAILSPLPGQPEITEVPTPASAAAEVRPPAVECPPSEAPPPASEGNAADVRVPADEAIPVPPGDRQEECTWARFVGAVVFATGASYPRPPAPAGAWRRPVSRGKESGRLARSGAGTEARIDCSWRTGRIAADVLIS